MKAYTTKHIITTIIVLVIYGGLFGYCYGWPFGLAVGGTFVSYALTVFFKNSTYPLFGWSEQIDTKTFWKMMGCTMLFVLGVILVCAAMSEGTDAIPRAIMLSCGYILSLLGGYLTRKIWLNNMPIE
mgnify:FL=1